ncbi:MAG: TonB family protein [Proteobacteria bacterium]|nr:TonB family protein [Pseudomonadota bacterium]
MVPPKIIEPPKRVEPPKPVEKPVEKVSPPPVPKPPKTLPKPDTVKEPAPKTAKTDSRTLAVTPKGKEAPTKRDTKKSKDAEPEPTTKTAKTTTKPAIKIADTSHLASRQAEESAKAKQRELDEERAQERAQALAAAKAAQQAHLQRVAKMNSILGGIQGGLSSPVDIHIDAGGGPNALAFLDYGQMMVRIYEQAWLVPPSLSDSLSVVSVTVTVARNGRVLEWHLAKPSGNSAVDKSVRETLQKVIQFDPFPASFRESQRTFNIDFNLKAKRTTG